MRLTTRVFLMLCVALFCHEQYAKGDIVKVTTLEDDFVPNGNCTLREAVRTIESTSEVDACTFESSTGNEIDLQDLSGILTLTLGEIVISSAAGVLNIIGPGSSQLQLSSNGLSSIFRLEEAQFVGINNLGFVSATVSISVAESFLIVGGGRFIGNDVGISARNAGLSILNSTFEMNGTGINMNGGELVVQQSLISQNERGITFGDVGSFVISESTLSFNELIIPQFANPTYPGGAGVLIHQADGRIVNSTISSNKGGGIWVQGGGSVTISSSTIYGNTRVESGNTIRQGGISTFFVGGGGEITLSSTIIAGNEGYDISANIISEGYNLIGVGDPDGFTPNIGDQVGTTGNVIDPMLGSLAFNGGSTQTHDLTPGSPAIDTGRCPDLVSDQRGYSNPSTGSRVVDIVGANNFADGCDVGAVEYNAVGVSVEQETEIPGDNSKEFIVSSAYPNPFTNQASFTLMVSVSQEVHVGIYDLLGRQIQVLNGGLLKANIKHRFKINGFGLPSGIYFYSVSGETFSSTGKIVLLK